MRVFVAWTLTAKNELSFYSEDYADWEQMRSIIDRYVKELSANPYKKYSKEFAEEYQHSLHTTYAGCIGLYVTDSHRFVYKVCSSSDFADSVPPQFYNRIVNEEGFVEGDYDVVLCVIDSCIDYHQMSARSIRHKIADGFLDDEY